MKQKYKTGKKIVKNGLYILTGTFINAVGLSLFLEPNRLAAGGIGGISIILNHLIHIPVGTWYFILNVPILLTALIVFGGKFIASTAVSILLITIFTNLLSPCGAVTNDPMLAAIAGGGLTAAGIGLVFRAGTTTGGSDIIVRIIKKKRRHVKTGSIFTAFDFMVVAVSAIVFKNIETALYAAVCIGVFQIVMNYVLYGPDGAKLIYIISSKPDEITKRLHEEDLGVTHLYGSGTYDGREKKVIFCAVRQQRLPGIREIVNKIDDKSFMIVTSATEIFGEGFKSHDSEEL